MTAMHENEDIPPPPPSIHVSDIVQVIYDPSNFYLVHMDRKNEPAMRRDLETFIEDWDNVRYESSVYTDTLW